MSEVISTTFNASSAEFVSEVKKARSAVDELSGRVLPALEQGFQKAQAQALQTAKGMQQVQKGAQNSGANMLQLSYFVDDLQYGFRGIANNLPGLVQGLGGSMGLAGAISIAGLALATVIPLMYKFYTAGDSENIVAGAKAYAESLKESVAEMRKFNAELAVRRELEESMKSFQESLATQTGVSPSITQAENDLEALRKNNALEAQIEEAQGQARIAQARANGEDVARVEEQVLAQKMAADAKRLEAEIAMQKKIADLRQMDAELIGAGASVSQEEFAKQQQEMDARIADLQNRAATAQASLKQAEEEAKDINPYTNEDYIRDMVLTGGNTAQVAKMRAEQEAQNALLADNLRIAQEQAAKTKEQLDAEMKRAETIDAMSKMSEEQRKSALKAAEEAAEAARRRVEELEDQQAAQGLLNEAKKEEARLNTVLQEKRNQDSDNQKKNRDEEKERRDQEEAARRKTALTDMQAELLVMKAQAAGQKEFAAEMQKRIDLAKEARDIAAATGLSEKEALAFAVEKMKLEEQIKKREEGEKRGAKKDGRIRLFRAGESPSTLQRGAAGTMLRTEAFTKRTQAWMGKTPKPTRLDQIAESQLEVQKKLLNSLSKALGIV